MTMHPFDLPEIRSVIAQFLTPRSLAVCTRVSQAWNQTCLPLLWKELTPLLHPGFGYNKASFRCHAHLIKSIDNTFYADYSLAGFPSGVYRNVHFPNLENMIRIVPSPAGRFFIHRHRFTLVYLELEYTNAEDLASPETSEDLWETIASCSSLKSLWIADVYVTYSCWPVCWSLWSRLISLRLVGINFWCLQNSSVNSPWPQRGLSSLSDLLAQEDLCQPPLRIKTLGMECPLNMTKLEDQLALLKHCPDLEAFIWRVNPCLFTVEQYKQQLAMEIRHCPLLVNLTINFADERRTSLAPVLEARAASGALPLQSLRLPKASFDKATWELIRMRYRSTLRTLELGCSIDDDEGVVQDILCSMTSLEELKAQMIEGLDMVQDPRPWLCLGLKRLILGIGLSEGNNPTIRKELLRRLGTLQNLRYCELRTNLDGGHWIHFRLAEGLEELRNLRQLRVLSFEYLPQNLKMQDLHWMMDNWPRLHTVLGDLNSWRTRNKSLKEVLEEGGITTKIFLQRI